MLHGPAHMHLPRMYKYMYTYMYMQSRDALRGRPASTAAAGQAARRRDEIPL